MPKNTSNQAVTKKDLKRLASKADIKTLKDSDRALWREVLKVEERVENIEEGQKRMEKTLGDKFNGVEVKIDRIMNQLDGFVGIVNNLTIDNEVGANQVRELDIKAENHEKRIGKLESSRINPQ